MWRTNMAMHKYWCHDHEDHLAHVGTVPCLIHIAEAPSPDEKDNSLDEMQPIIDEKVKDKSIQVDVDPMYEAYCTIPENLEELGICKSYLRRKAKTEL